MTKTRDLADLGGGFIQAGTGAVQRTVESKLQDVVSVKDFGAALDGTTNDATALSNANAAAVAAKASLLISGIIHVGTATTITAPIVDGTHQMFSTTSAVTVDNKMPVRPEWWGAAAGSLIKAIEALPTTGGVVQLLPTDYNIVGIYHNAVGGPHVGNEKKNVKLRGSGMPRKSSDGTRFISGSGTVIQGTFINYADGFEAYDLGVDVGSYVTSTFNFGGFYPEGFVPGTHKFQGTPTDYSTYIQNVSFGNIKVLAVDNLNHAVLCEFINGLSHGYVECDGGYHGYVCKSTNVRGGNVWAYGQSGDAYIIKSDQYTRCQNVIINSITIGKRGLATRTPPGFIQSTNGGHITNTIQIGILQGWNCQELLTRVGDAEAITDITIGEVLGDDIQGNGLTITGDMRRVQIGKHIISNTTANGIFVAAAGESIDIGSGVVTNAGQDGYYLNSAAVTHGDINSINAANFGVRRLGSTVLDWNRVTGSGNGSGIASSLYELLTSANLQNSWVNAGTWPFQVVQVGRTLHFRGTVRDGTTMTIATLPVGYRPGSVLSFLTVAIDTSSNRTFAHVDVLTNGEIQVANFATLGGTSCIVALNFNYIL